ncbi:MAG: GMC oxidoreductase [Candidatus Dormiibacterota bacterium]
MFCVVGSGPAGVACAQALLKAGEKVTLLDAGTQLEPEREARLASLRAIPHQQWTPASLAFLRDGVTVTAGGIPMKRAYGSDFPFREPVPLPMAHNRAEGQPSYARGGLSNVWGASVLPFRSQDMGGWPIGIENLEAHYRAVLNAMPLSARVDRLGQKFPLYHDHPAALRESSQAAALLRDLEAGHAGLLDHGIWFGTSRLAVQGSSNGRPGCVYCAQCMYGCPFGYIYNSADMIDRLGADGGFEYRPGVLAEEVAETGRGVVVKGRDLDTGAPFDMRADRVFLACGVFSTARVLLASLDAYGKAVHALDNCYFLFPLLRYRGQKEAAHESLHTLAQVFLEIEDPTIGPHTTHLQVYTHNELFRKQVRNMLGALDGPLGPAVERLLLTRMLLVQGYLHSDLSPGMTLTLARGESGGPAVLEVAIQPNPRTRPAVSAVLRRLRAERSSLRAIPLGQALRIGAPGRGFHTGGTFPMRSSPGPFETDTMGRPFGMSRVHVVDASVLPALPATTITLSVMANAHRIGSEAAA